MKGFTCIIMVLYYDISGIQWSKNYDNNLWNNKSSNKMSYGLDADHLLLNCNCISMKKFSSKIFQFVRDSMAHIPLVDVLYEQCSSDDRPLFKIQHVSNCWIFSPFCLSLPHSSDHKWHQRQTPGTLMKNSRHRPSRSLLQTSVSILSHGCSEPTQFDSRSSSGFMVRMWRWPSVFLQITVWTVRIPANKHTSPSSPILLA